MSKSLPAESTPIYFFEEGQRSILSSLSRGDDVFVSEKNSNDVAGLASRGFVATDEHGKVELTEQGSKAISEEGLLPFTRHFKLNKAERLTVELLMHGVDNVFILRGKDMAARLAANGMDASPKARKAILDSLERKGLVVRRSNNMWYFTKGIAVVAGVYKGKPPADAYKEAQAFHVLPGELIKAVIEGEAPSLLSLVTPSELEQKRPRKGGYSKKSKPEAVEASSPETESSQTPETESTPPPEVTLDLVTEGEDEVSPNQGDLDLNNDAPADDCLEEIALMAKKLSTPAYQVKNLKEKVALLGALKDQVFANPGSPSALILSDIINDLEQMG